MKIKECDCECHEEGSNILHFMPCCSQCPKCGKNFSHGWREHVEECDVVPIPKRKKPRWTQEQHESR